MKDGLREHAGLGEIIKIYLTGFAVGFLFQITNLLTSKTVTLPLSNFSFDSVENFLLFLCIGVVTTIMLCVYTNRKTRNQCESINAPVNEKLLFIAQKVITIVLGAITGLCSVGVLFQ